MSCIYLSFNKYLTECKADQLLQNKMQIVFAFLFIDQVT